MTIAQHFLLEKARKSNVENLWKNMGKMWIKAENKHY